MSYYVCEECGTGLEGACVAIDDDLFCPSCASRRPKVSRLTLAERALKREADRLRHAELCLDEARVGYASALKARDEEIARLAANAAGELS